MPQSRTGARRPVLLVTLALGATLAILGLGSAAASPDERATVTTQPGAYDEPASVAPGATEVAIGFYPVTIQGLNQQDNSYYIDFFMWMRWTGDRNPVATVELTNNIERWGLTMARVYDKPKVLASGEKIQEFRVQGQFFQALDLTDYPLDSHTLRIDVEDTTYTESELVYVADMSESGVDPDVRIPGWNITGWELPIIAHTYETSFGEANTGVAESTYSAAQFGIEIERPRTFFLWKLLLPLVIVLLLAGSVLFVHPSLIEVRLAAPATALLSLVFLQQTYSETLPEIGSLVLLDKIYALAYGVIIVLILVLTVTSYWVRDEGEVATARAFRLDHIAAASTLGVFVIGSALLILLR